MSPQDTVRSILASKGAHVWSIGPDATVYEAIVIMAEREIGSMPVIDNSGELVGLISESAITPGKSSCKGDRRAKPPSPTS